MGISEGQLEVKAWHLHVAIPTTQSNSCRSDTSLISFISEMAVFHREAGMDDCTTRKLIKDSPESNVKYGKT